MSRLGGILKDSSKRFRCFLIGLWDEARVDVERRARIPMTQSAGDGAHVDTRGEETRRHVMTEIMEANPRDPSVLTDPPERSGGQLGSGRPNSECIVTL